MSPKWGLSFSIFEDKNMLTKLVIKNFKRIEIAEIDLTSVVVFVGPNNSGKTSVLQAISLWDLGVKKWFEAKKRSKAKSRIGVPINRKDILTAPVPSAVQLWKDLSVRKSKSKEKGKGTENILIEISVEGYTRGKDWKLGLEFDYQNPESFYCRFIGDPQDFPEEALLEKIGYLPPMSGLSSLEDKYESGSIHSRIGEGRTAEVLRNICLSTYKENNQGWKELLDLMDRFFHVKIQDPIFDPATGRISMSYKEGSKPKMDIANSGKGFQQVLLLFSYIFAWDNTILLMDEPDAHLEFIRQKEIYNTLSEIIKAKGSQLIVATHSEVVLNEAFGKDRVIAFLGKPHTLNDRHQLIKSLTSIGFDQYIQAQDRKKVLYLEGSSDLALLKAFSDKINHPISNLLNSTFIKYVETNIPNDARNHFNGLKECVPELKGIALFDKIKNPLQDKKGLKEIMWSKREIENYIPMPSSLMGYANKRPEDLFDIQDLELMKKLIEDYVPPIALRDKKNNWWNEIKITDDFLDKILPLYFKRLNKPVLINKGDYALLISFVDAKEIDPEVRIKLDTLYEVLK